jgi:signal transduction histidine kinase
MVVKNIIILFISLLAISGKLFSQDVSSGTIRINDIPPQGILLDKGWVYLMQDDQEFARPEYQDAGWQPIDPTQDIFYLPQINNGSIGWLRIKFSVDSGLLNKPLAFKVYQSLASEIYLNGKQIIQFGTIGNEQSNTAAYRPGNDPGAIIFTQRDQVLAVRFAIQKNLPYTATTHPYFALRFRILQIKDSSRFREISSKYPFLNMLWAGMFLVLAMIHMAIYLWFKNRKADLYFSLAMIAEMLAHMIYYVLDRGDHSMSFIAYGFSLDWLLLLSLYNLFLYLAIREFFNIRKAFIHWTVLVSLFFGVVIFFVSYKYGQFILSYGGFLPTVILSIIMAWKAFISGKKEALIIVTGFGIYLLINTCFLLFYGGILSDVNTGIFAYYSLTDTLYFISIISVPLCLSFYLSLDFANTSRNLEDKLREVQMLSAQSIRQEQEKKAILSHQNELLEKQVEERTADLKYSLEKLKAAQHQLVQSEKMASLGELTAGIAHEIQNPLNFVNNFAEINTELIEEAEDAIDKGNQSEAKHILSDLKENEKKIRHHGQRADAIVKSMLQHSRTSSGQKEPTDINGVADEYLRLAFHGLRAKDKSFNAILNTDFDPAAGKLNIVSQDIGRVLLNLFNNAFYAVQEKSKLVLDQSYSPAVSVSTKRSEKEFVITIGDNGLGIPEKVTEKIFQPFFTTKPTGQGTGLGLSLSYDIIKAHGGEISIKNNPGEGAEFIITLPIDL